jgi:hypothetical protein
MEMNRSFWFAIILTVSFAVVSCSPPIGYIQGGSLGVDFDDFWTVPRRNVYNLGDSFVRASDLWVFASSQGIVRSIPVDKVNIGLISNPDAAVPYAPIPITNGEYILNAAIVGAGRKLIVVSYGDKTAKYSIEVMDPSGLTGGKEVGGEEGTGINIIWR